MSDLNSVLIEGRVKRGLKLREKDSANSFELLSELHRGHMEKPRKNCVVVFANDYRLLSGLEVGTRVRVIGALNNDANGRMRIEAEHIEKL